MKFKTGDKVVMFGCMEADTYQDRVWTCRTDSFERHGFELVFLEGFAGSFACEFLKSAPPGYVEPTMMRPCDCLNEYDAKKLREQGIAHNEQGITVKGHYVELQMDHTSIKIPTKRFKMFAQWFLEAQEIKK